MKKLFLILPFLIFASPALADSPFTLTVNPVFQDDTEGFGKNEIDLLEKTDHFNVILKSTSDKVSPIRYSTCSDPLVSRLSFSLKSGSGKNYQVYCGLRPQICERNISRSYPLEPQEMLVFEISSESCEWNILSDIEKQPNVYEMQAIYKIDDKLSVKSDSQKYKINISIPAPRDSGITGPPPYSKTIEDSLNGR